VSERWSRALRPRSPYPFDAFVALVSTVLCTVVLFTAERSTASNRDADALGVILVFAAAGSLAFRRRWPVGVYLVASAATIGLFARDYPDSGLPLVVLIALYTVAARCPRWVTVAATASILLAIAAVVAPESDMDGGSLAAALVTYVAAAAWGDRRKVLDAYAEQLELRAAEKERERVEASERAVAEERLRIARELHDVVAHAMSVVAVQSGVGAHVIDNRPDQAKRILETISRTSRDSLDEMRRLLGVLRSEPAPGDPPASADVELSPAPGLAGLEALVDRVTEAGVPVTAEVQGSPTAVPAGVDLAAYRIVQEALTNVLKHAGRARAQVLVRYEPGRVCLEVVDDGRGAVSAALEANGSARGSGHGLVGMRERAALYGGGLEAGPRPGGGYRVAATLRYGAP
jgi:signal transduction histidine kinase